MDTLIAQVFGLDADLRKMMEDRKRTVTVECWRWRYRDPTTHRVCQTVFPLTEREAATLPEATRIEGSMLLREVAADDFPDTGPRVHALHPE